MLNSKPIKIKSKAKGNKWKNANNPPADNIVQENPAIIFNKVWPEVIFANKRIDNVKTRII